MTNCTAQTVYKIYGRLPSVYSSTVRLPYYIHCQSVLISVSRGHTHTHTLTSLVANRRYPMLTESTAVVQRTDRPTDRRSDRVNKGVYVFTAGRVCVTGVETAITPRYCCSPLCPLKHRYYYVVIVRSAIRRCNILE